MIENQTLITDNDVNEMARSMGLEVIESPSTDGGNVTSMPVYPINGEETPVDSVEGNVEASEDDISQIRERVENVENTENPFWVNDIIEESAADEDSTLDPNSAPTTTDELLEATVNPNIIPPISESVNTAESTVRFSGASWFEAAKGVTATIAGVGGIGSWTSLLLSRISTSIRINLYDDDKVEVVNLAGQMFSSNQVGHYKVYAAQEVIRYFSGSYCNAIPYRIT